MMRLYPMSDDYDERSALQREIMLRDLNHFQEAVEKAVDNAAASSEHSSPFIVLELGCSTGRNSIIPVTFIRNLLQSSGKALLVMQNDVNDNEWSKLFKNTSAVEGVFFAGIGRSFYDAVTPGNFVNFCFSFTALHWSDTHRVLPTCDKEFLSQHVGLRADGERSFERLVSLTSCSLKKGGVAFWSFLGTSSDDPEQSLNDFSAVRYLYAIAPSWSEVLGISIDEAKAHFTLPTVHRSLDSVTRVLEKHYEIQVISCRASVADDPLSALSDMDWAREMSSNILGVIFPAHAQVAKSKWPEKFPHESSVKLAFQECLRRKLAKDVVRPLRRTQIVIAFMKK